MALIISRRSSYCPNFATAPLDITLAVDDNAECIDAGCAVPGCATGQESA